MVELDKLFHLMPQQCPSIIIRHECLQTSVKCININSVIGATSPAYEQFNFSFNSGESIGCPGQNNDYYQSLWLIQTVIVLLLYCDLVFTVCQVKSCVLNNIRYTVFGPVSESAYSSLFRFEKCFSSGMQTSNIYELI